MCTCIHITYEAMSVKWGDYYASRRGAYMFLVASAAAAARLRRRRKSFGLYLHDRLLVPHHFTHRDILGLGNSGGGGTVPLD